LGTGEDVPLYKEAAVKYVHEVVCHDKEVLGLTADAYTPPARPKAEGKSGGRPHWIQRRFYGMVRKAQ
jgi:hypothetical protein